jgi:hypothetical protein
MCTAQERKRRYRERVKSEMDALLAEVLQLEQRASVLSSQNAVLQSHEQHLAVLVQLMRMQDLSSSDPVLCSGAMQLHELSPGATPPAGHCAACGSEGLIRHKMQQRAGHVDVSSDARLAANWLTLCELGMLVPHQWQLIAELGPGHDATGPRLAAATSAALCLCCDMGADKPAVGQEGRPDEQELAGGKAYATPSDATARARVLGIVAAMDRSYVSGLSAEQLVDAFASMVEHVALALAELGATRAAHDQLAHWVHNICAMSVGSCCWNAEEAWSVGPDVGL